MQMILNSTKGLSRLTGRLSRLSRLSRLRGRQGLA